MDETESTFSNDSSDPECPICLGPFTEPKIMLCGHVTCRVCLLTWIRAQDQKVGCPLCRHPMIELYIVNAPDEFVVLLVDSLPTHHVMRATARGKRDITPDTCSGCEDLLCTSRRYPHPECPGQDVQNTEADAREALKDLCDKVQAMVETSDKLEKDFQDMEAEVRGLVDVNETGSFRQDHTRLIVNGCKTIKGELRSVLLTHQHILQRMGASHQYVAIILMWKPMQDRIERIRRKLDLLKQCFVRWS